MTVVLENISEFKELLKDYKPSGAAIETLRDMPLVIMLGVTGSGRNTIINHLVNSGKYHFIVSDTTRPPKLRDGMMEQNGVQYNFLSEDQVISGLKNGEYLEAELIHNQQVSGINIRELQTARSTGKVPVNEIEIGGTEVVHSIKPDTKFFFVIPPSYKEWMYRLQGREVMSHTELENRLKTARRILELALSRDYFIFIVNDSSHASASLIDDYVTESIPAVDDADARQVARTILEDLHN